MVVQHALLRSQLSAGDAASNDAGMTCSSSSSRHIHMILAWLAGLFALTNANVIRRDQRPSAVTDTPGQTSGLQGFVQMKLTRNPRATTCFVEFMDVPAAMAVHDSQQVRSMVCP
jgi:hypothetical protein